MFNMFKRKKENTPVERLELQLFNEENNTPPRLESQMGYYYIAEINSKVVLEYYNHMLLDGNVIVELESNMDAEIEEKLSKSRGIDDCEAKRQFIAEVIKYVHANNLNKVDNSKGNIQAMNLF